MATTTKSRTRRGPFADVHAAAQPAGTSDPTPVAGAAGALRAAELDAERMLSPKEAGQALAFAQQVIRNDLVRSTMGYRAAGDGPFSSPAGREWLQALRDGHVPDPAVSPTPDDLEIIRCHISAPVGLAEKLSKPGRTWTMNDVFWAISNDASASEHATSSFPSPPPPATPGELVPTTEEMQLLRMLPGTSEARARALSKPGRTWCAQDVDRARAQLVLDAGQEAAAQARAGAVGSPSPATSSPLVPQGADQGSTPVPPVKPRTVH